MRHHLRAYLPVRGGYGRGFPGRVPADPALALPTVIVTGSTAQPGDCCKAQFTTIAYDTTTGAQL
jgi:hypothetical protein